MFCYTMVFAVIFIVYFTLSARNASMLAKSLQKYFFCEQGGHNPRNPCSRSEIEDLTYPSLEIMSNIFQALFPVVTMIYVVNIQELKALRRGKGVVIKSSSSSSRRQS